MLGVPPKKTNGCEGSPFCKAWSDNVPWALTRWTDY